jgi:hypothetical protein
MTAPSSSSFLALGEPWGLAGRGQSRWSPEAWESLRLHPPRPFCWGSFSQICGLGECERGRGKEDQQWTEKVGVVLKIKSQGFLWLLSLLG